VADFTLREKMIKRTLLLFNVVLLLMLGTQDAVGQVVKNEPERTIRVRGVGKVRVLPDQLRLSIQVNVPRAETAVEALTRNSQLTTRLLALLKRFGISEADIQTTRVSINPIYDYDKRISPPPIIGYSAQNEVLVVVKKIEDTGRILDQAVKTGASGFGPLQYESSRRTEFEREALKRAADDARTKAELLARELGATLGRVLTISESSVPTPSPIVPMAMEARTISAEVPVMAGEIEISATVEIVFELM
jgi:uncharacterized protein YggE